MKGKITREKYITLPFPHTLWKDLLFSFFNGRILNLLSLKVHIDLEGARLLALKFNSS